MKKRPLIIGSLQFEYPFVLAPLAGITDKTMRSLCSSAGASLTYTEMVSAKGLWYGDRKTGELLRIGENEGPVGFQLFGCEPEILAYAVRLLSDPAHAKAVDARMAERFTSTDGNRTDIPADGKETGSMSERDAEAAGPGAAEPGSAGSTGFRVPGSAVNRPPMGARTVQGQGLKPPALFDLNAGCPVPKIVRNGEGSALLKDPDLLHDCVAAMVRASWEAAAAGQIETDGQAITSGGAGPIPITVKIRKGFAFGDDCAVEIARAAEAAGAAAVTVHGRTRQQFYEGDADWDVIRRVKEAVGIPVIGNGDVHTGADAIRMIEKTGCDGVMIARGALGNPWVFIQARALWDELPDTSSPGACFAAAEDIKPTEEERIRLLLRHIDMVCADKGERVAVREMRKHVGWYIKGMRGATGIRRRINTANSIAEMKRILREYR